MSRNDSSWSDAWARTVSPLIGGVVFGAIGCPGGESRGLDIRTQSGGRFKVWVECDPEGNGPGWVDVERESWEPTGAGAAWASVIQAGPDEPVRFVGLCAPTRGEAETEARKLYGMFPAGTDAVAGVARLPWGVQPVARAPIPGGLAWVPVVGGEQPEGVRP